MEKLFSGIKKLVRGAPGEKKRDLSPPRETCVPVSSHEENQSAKLVVMGRESSFSREIIEYGLDMAQRMNYEIIALNTAPLSSGAFEMFSSSIKQVCRDFKSLSVKNSEPFKAESGHRNIPFTHRVKYTDVDGALEEIFHEFGNVGFVVSELESEGGAIRENQTSRDSGILVYSMH